MLGERITRRDLGAVAACVIGMGLAFGGELGGGRAAGNALAVLSSFGFAGLPLLLRLDQRRLLAKTGDDRRDEAATRIAGHAPLLTISLGNAIASLVDERGRILVAGLRPPPIPDSVRRALVDITPGDADGPPIDPDWGEHGLTAAERVFAWNALEVLAFVTGNPEHPVNAIPPRASAHLQIRFVAGCDHAQFLPALRVHLQAHGYANVCVAASDDVPMRATRLDPEHPWVRTVAASIERTSGRKPAVLPNIGGSLPNDCFAEVLGLPTVWIPHSYPRMLAARARRASARVRRARGTRDHDGALLRSRRR
jgi:hypothetical protein